MNEKEIKEELPEGVVSLAEHKEKDDENKISVLAQYRYDILQSDTQARIAKYRLYEHFTAGRQWIRLPSRAAKGRTQRTINMCDPIVRKFASLLMGEVPQISVPRKSELAPIFDVSALPNAKPTEAKNRDDAMPEEFNRSEAIEKILRNQYFRKNKVQKEWKEGAYNGSKLGDTIFYVTIDPKTKNIRYENIFPGHVRIGFGSNDHRDVEYAIIDKVMSLTEIQRQYNIIAEAEQIDDTVWTSVIPRPNS